MSPTSQSPRSYAPPEFSRWTSSPATDAAKTPQEAFAAGMRLSLCAPSATRSVTQTWLVSGPDFGVVWVIADCGANTDDPRPVYAQFVIRRDPAGAASCARWTGNNAGFSTKLPLPGAQQYPDGLPPSWLPLPQDVYWRDPVITSAPPSSLVSWVGASHHVFAGRFLGAATRPAAASDVTVDGISGWMSHENGFATVVLPEPGVVTFFFSGDAPDAQIRSYAALVHAHAGALLTLPARDDSPLACG